MAPRRKPVVDEADVHDNWHLRPGRGRGGSHGAWAHKAAKKDDPARREPPRPLQEVVRDFPRLDAIYEGLPAYSVEPPPERPKL